MFYDDIGHFIIPPYGKSLEDLNQIQYSFDDVIEHIQLLIKTGLEVDKSFDISRNLDNIKTDFETLEIDKVFNNYVGSDIKEKFLSSFLKPGKINNIISNLSIDMSLIIDEKMSLDSLKIRLNEVLEQYTTMYSQSIHIFSKNENNDYILSENLCGNLFEEIISGKRITDIGEAITSNFATIYDKLINLYSSDIEYYEDLTKKGLFDAMAKVFNNIYYLIMNSLIIERMVMYDILEGLEDENDIEEYRDSEVNKDLEFSMEKDSAFTNLGGLTDKLRAKKGVTKVDAGLTNYFEKTVSNLNTVKKKFNLFKRKKKNYFFYRKYLGRIDHLYERYASDAIVLENKMKDDPVTILNETAKEYIEKYSNDNVKIYKIVEGLAEKIDDVGADPKACLKILAKYLGSSAINERGIKKLPNLMIKATKRKIAEALLENNKIYGYTVDSIVEKDFPNPNHTIASLFVDNPHEKPQEQPVSDIFQTVDSFKMIAANSKKPIFDISEISQKIIRTGIQPSSVNKLMGGMKKSFIKGKKGDGERVEGDKLTRNQMKIIFKSLEGSLNYISSMKAYGSKLIEYYFTMMMRIDNLCKICVKSMLNVERGVKDERHNTGFKHTRLGAHKGYVQAKDNHKTANELDEVKEERRERNVSRINEMREAMRRARNF